MPSGGTATMTDRGIPQSLEPSAGLPPQVRGTFGHELIVLSLSDVRQAEELHAPIRLDTANGEVKGRDGDIVITAPWDERYPIKRAIFYGTYQVLGRVGVQFVANRLIHVRRAWPVLSPHAEVDYGPDRGVVAAPKGSWVYRCDDDDY